MAADSAGGKKVKRDAGGRKKAAPYNKYVQKFREDKYHYKRKELRRYQRFQRYDEKVQGKAEPSCRVEASASLMDRVVAEGMDAIDQEYEDRLSFSFGSGDGFDRSDRDWLKNKKKKRRRNENHDDTEAPRPKKKKKNSKVDDDANTGAIDANSPAKPDTNSDTKKPKKKKKGSKENVETSEKLVSNSTTKSTKKDKTPVQFSKAMRQYEEKQEEKAAERRKIEEEIQNRSRARRQTAKQRAVKGDLLSQKTSKGQPRMNSMLEFITTKLEKEKRAGQSVSVK